MHALSRYATGALLLVACALPPSLEAEVAVRLEPAARPATPAAGGGKTELAGDGALVLPYFAVDAGDPQGETTLFAVRNNGSSPVTVRFTYFAAGGGDAAVVEERQIAPHAVRTVNLRAVEGLPVDDRGLAEGFVVAQALGAAAGAGVLSGDFFRLDPAQAAANGGSLRPALDTSCRRWSHRFLSGGPFTGSTRIAFLALDRPATGPAVAGNVYNEAGDLVAVVSVTADQDAFEISDADLELPVKFGSIDWVFQGQGHGAVSATFSASGLFSVGAEAACTEDAETIPGAVLFELPGTFLTCDGCANWQFDMPFDQRREFSKVTVDFDLFVAGWDPARPNGFHAIFWLNNGSRWQDMMGYLNSRGTQNRTVFQSNGPLGNPIGVEIVTYPGVEVGQSYHVHYEYDTIDKVVWYEIRTPSGELRVGDAIPLPAGVGKLSTSYTFIQFGSQPGGPVESLTEGWRWSNLRALFIP
ncbi:MAG: hypothetical protein D6696_05220 [Acidobacteria bacterium]|nr:MAG: hypothetical protein D6696_05220 [Acidobacteriota bacterium]